MRPTVVVLESSRVHGTNVMERESEEHRKNSQKDVILTKPDTGWAWVVMGASFVIHGLNGGILYGAGIIQVSLLERFHKSISVTSWAVGLFIFFMSSAGVIGSWIINRWGCRMSVLAGSVIMTIGMVVCFLVDSLELIYIFYGVIGGGGSGIIFTTGVVVVGLNFDKKRSMATGIASCGAGVGAFLLSPLIQMSIDEYGNRGVFFIMAGISINMCVFGALCYPSYLESNKNELDLTKANLSVSLLSLSTKEKSLRKTISVFVNIPFICLCLSLLSSHLGIYLMYVHLPSFSISRGTSEFQASFLMSMTGLTNCICRLLIGFAGNAENISNIILYFGTFGMLGLATVLFPLYGASFLGQVIFAAFLGSYSGCCYVLLNTITPELVGVENLASAFGIEMVFSGVGTLIGPPLAGFIVDGGGTYESSFVVAGISALLAAVLGLAAEVFKQLANTDRGKVPPEEATLYKDEKVNMLQNT